MAEESLWPRRQILKSTGAGLAAGLAGCAGNGGDGGGNGNNGPTTVNYLDREEQTANTYPPAFNETHDQIEVKGKKVGDRYEDVITQIRAGEQPGDVLGIDVVQMGMFNDLGALADIGSFVDGLEYRDDFLGGLDPLFFKVGGTTVAVPFWIDASLYYYNKNHFEEAGLDPESPPATWAEFEEAAAALKDVNDKYPPIGTSFTGGLTEFFWWPWVWANGGQIINDAGDEAKIGEQPAVEALEFWVNLSDQGYTTDLIGTEWPDFHNMFAGGNTSIMFSSGYGVGFVEDNNQEMFENGNFGTAAFPKPEGGTRSAFLGGNSVSILSDVTENQDQLEASQEFLRWINSEEGMKATQEVGYLPARSRGFEIGQYAEEPYSTYLEGPKQALEEGTVLIHPKYEAISQRIRPAVERAIAGDAAPDQALSNAAKKINNEVFS